MALRVHLAQHGQDERAVWDGGPRQRCGADAEERGQHRVHCQHHKRTEGNTPMNTVETVEADR